MTEMSTGAVIIGRNEGDRLRACLSSMLHKTAITVYGDSGSTDNSVELANAMGAVVLPLDMTLPFTAARARNAGFHHLLAQHPKTRFVQFVDGDCNLVEGWLVATLKHLESHPHFAVICGRRRPQRIPERPIFNRMCDRELNSPAGGARAVGLRARRQCFKCRRRSMLATDTVLFGIVQHFLAQAWSPSQIAGTLKLMWPDKPQRTVSHETIYTCIYASPKGKSRKTCSPVFAAPKEIACHAAGEKIAGARCPIC